MAEVEIGTISDFFARPVVASVELSGEVSTGDNIHIKGHTTDIEVTITSIQIHNQEVTSAHAGNAVGIKVTDKVRHGDKVFKMVD